MGDERMNISEARLRQFIQGIEQVNAEIAEKTEYRRDIFAEAKGEGYDVAVMKIIIAQRKKSPADLAEEEAVLETYKSALGMQ